VVARLSAAAGISSAPVDFGTGTRIFSMSSDFGTAFRCHGDVFRLPPLLRVVCRGVGCSIMLVCSELGGYW
jgi:hypothetical protein